MKLTEFIQRLQEIAGKHPDIEVKIADWAEQYCKAAEYPASTFCIGQDNDLIIGGHE